MRSHWEITQRFEATRDRGCAQFHGPKRNRHYRRIERRDSTQKIRFNVRPERVSHNTPNFLVNRARLAQQRLTLTGVEEGALATGTRLTGPKTLRTR